MTVRFTEEEYAALKGKCEIAGMKMEPFVRALVDGCRIKPAPPDSYNKLRQQLSAIGNNLNQLTHVANATGRVSASQLDRAQSLLEDMWRCVRDISAMKFSAKHKKMRRKTALIYSEAERKEIERVYGVFKDYIHASKFLDFVWSEKLGYLLLHIDPTKNTIEEDQIIASADELCAELFNEVATDVFQEAKREHFYPDADDDEIAEIRRRWQPYLDLLPEYRSSCRAFHTAE